MGKVENEAVSRTPISRTDLEFMAGFQCEHWQDKGETCYDHPEQGGVCNSCWIRSFAQKKLSKMQAEEIRKSSLKDRNSC